MSANNSKPKNEAPVVVLREEPSNLGRLMLLMLPAMIGSVLFHAGLIALFVVYVMLTREADAAPLVQDKTETINAEEVEQKKETFTVVDVDPSMSEADTDIQYMADRIAEVSVPGSVNPTEQVGIKDGDKAKEPFNVAAPGGYLTKGQGGALETTGPGNGMAVGEVGGYSPRGMPLQGTFYGRSGATREYALREGGGTDASEAAVTKGLQWLVRQQQMDGSWVIPGRPIAGTALGLLPFLAAGKTHKPADKNPYDKQILKGLMYLIKKQGKDGYFGTTMYDHGLATIAMCEAFGLSQDPNLRRPAQNAINLILKNQGDGGGWSYNPDNGTHRDLSISGWQIMAIKSAQMSGLIVPAVAVSRSKTFLASCSSPDGGFGYLPGQGGTPRMTAVGMLCRQYMENKGPSDADMQKGVKNYIRTNPPDRQDVYYYYYATQVMHHFGGEAWRDWNEKMREYLIKRQDVTKTANFGSWSPEGDNNLAQVGGRLMMTSLNLLTLEVYYRYLPLYYRDAGYGKDGAVQKAL